MYADFDVYSRVRLMNAVSPNILFYRSKDILFIPGIFLYGNMRL